MKINLKNVPDVLQLKLSFFFHFMSWKSVFFFFFFLWRFIYLGGEKFALKTEAQE